MRDIRGASRLAIAGIAGIVDIVEAMHGNIAAIPLVRRADAAGTRTRGLTGIVYRSIRGVVGLVGHSLDALLERLAPLLGERSNWRGRDRFLAALNGVLGDYLAATGNPLATPMTLHVGPGAAADTGKVAVLIHGLCLDESSWRRGGHDYGAALARDLGYSTLYVRYNSGRSISANGRELAERLEAWAKASPVAVTQVALIGHSMGGLVARSACRFAELADHQWRRRVRHAVFLGTPHHGAPLERGGHWADLLLGASRYTAPLARLGKVRSAGITDLRHGSSLPLPEGVACYAIAATTSKAKKGVSELFGDGLVTVASALGRNDDAERNLPFDASRQWVARGVGHLGLLGNAAVYARIRGWLAEPVNQPVARNGSGQRRP
jgi:pimeloyl-ACP methyl ester carboxylesterase